MADNKQQSHLIKYGSYTPEDAEQDLRDSEEARQGDWLKLKVGKTYIRIMPPRMGQRRPYRVVYQHYVEIPGQEGKVTLVCPLLQGKNDGIVGRHCPVCAQIDDLYAEGAEQEAKDMKANREILYNVIDRGNEARGVLIMKVRPLLHEAICGLVSQDPKSPAHCDPINGYDICITRKGIGLDTKYTATPMRETTPLHDDVAVANAWLQQMHDLDKFVRIPDDDEVRERLSGGRGGGAPRTGASRQLGSGGRQRERNFGGPRARTAADDMEEVQDAEIVENE